MEENIFPHMRSIEDDNEIEEERRLCYVGITRAMKKLYLTFATTRMVFGKTKYHSPSRFLGDIPPILFGVEEKVEKKSTPSQSTGMIKRNVETNVSGSDKFAQYAGGERVRHPKWGTGTVVGVRGEAPKKQELDIVFRGAVGLRKVLLEYAPIERV